MNYRIHFLNAGGQLTSFISSIDEVIKSTLRLIEDKVKLEPLDIVVVNQPGSVIPEIGLGGHAPNKNLLYVYTDPARENFMEIIKTELPRTLTHELHHCARWGAIGFGETLLEALVSEGLAEHFDLEINKREPTLWATALNLEQIKQFLERAQKSFNDKKYNHTAWFFGSEKENIPRWTGYTLGFYIVGEYLKKSGRKASDLVGTEATLFI